MWLWKSRRRSGSWMLLRYWKNIIPSGSSVNRLYLHIEYRHHTLVAHPVGVTSESSQFSLIRPTNVYGIAWDIRQVVVKEPLVGVAILFRLLIGYPSMGLTSSPSRRWFGRNLRLETVIPAESMECSGALGGGCKKKARGPSGSPRILAHVRANDAKRTGRCPHRRHRLTALNGLTSIWLPTPLVHPRSTNFIRFVEMTSVEYP